MIEVLYMDNHVLAANKPAGIPTQSEDGTGFEDLCRIWLKEETGKPGNVYLHVTHRIDTPVSGIVLFARTSKALGRLQEAMRDKSIIKHYLALIEGAIVPMEGHLEHMLFHDEKNRCAIVSNYPKAKIAKLHYWTQKILEKATLVKIQLETGRYHQIRAQFKAAGHPVLGDFKYGSKQKFTADAIALHHSWMSFPHPTLGKNIDVSAPLPSYWPKV